MSTQPETQTTAGIAATQISNVDFSFRKNKDGVRRDTVSLNIPVPTANTIISILQDTSDENKKARNLVLDAVHSVVIGNVRSKVDADENFSQETLDGVLDQITLTAIANLPRSERSSTSKEELEAFAAAYVEFMPTLEGVTKKAAEAAGTLFVNRIKSIVGNEGALRKVQERINQFLAEAPEEVSSEHLGAITYLLTRLEEALGINYDAEAL